MNPDNFTQIWPPPERFSAGICAFLQKCVFERFQSDFSQKRLAFRPETWYVVSNKTRWIQHTFFAPASPPLAIWPHPLYPCGALAARGRTAAFRRGGGAAFFFAISFIYLLIIYPACPSRASKAAAQPAQGRRFAFYGSDAPFAPGPFL